jgi:hypothetical protein
MGIRIITSKTIKALIDYYCIINDNNSDKCINSIILPSI